MPDAPLSAGDDLRDELAELRRRIDAQARLIAEQQELLHRLSTAAEAASLASAPSAPSATDPSASVSSAGPTPNGGDQLGRRAVLRLAGAGAVGGAAAALVGATGTSPAVAATGGTMQLGYQNLAENPTQLQYDYAGTLNTSAAFAASDTSDFSSGFPSALAGFASGAKFNNGVYGWSQSGYGVVAKGVGTAAAGLYAFGATVGVNGLNATASDGTAFAVSATNTNGVSVFGQGLVGLASSAAGVNVRTYGFGLPPQQRSSAQLAGDLASDINKDLWYAVADGTPGTWRKVAGPGTAGALHVLPTTTRVYDSRPFPPNTGVKGTMTAGQTRAIDCTYAGAVPAGATAVLINITIVSSSPAGFLAAFRNGISWPGNSSVNWDHTGATVANTTVVAVNAGGILNLYASNPVDVLIDVIGYYR
ncbi:MAG: hypothetical protein U0Q07_05455 [Acidimicrobiales bacterium]